METVVLIFITLSAFIATNTDDLFILMVFFTRSEFHKWEIVLGQYLGMIALISLSSLTYLFQLIIPSYWISLLGVFPIIIGVKNLLEIKKSNQHNNNNHQNTRPKDIKPDKYGLKHGLNTFTVAMVTFTNGGDNIGVYAPLFAGLNPLELLQVVLLFLFMTGLWCILSFKLVDNKIIGDEIKKYAHLILPLVLIGIGAFILYRGVFLTGV